MAVARTVWLCLHTLLLTGSRSESHYENVALNKPCSMSGKWDGTDNANKAVNGNTSGIYTNTIDGNCVHTNLALHVWWEVDLERDYPICNITVYGREKHEARMRNCTIKIDGQNYYTFESDHTNQISSFYRQTPIYGRKVTVTKNTTMDVRIDERTINICEFEVLSCKARYWGASCERSCGECHGGAPCNKRTGHCDQGCGKPGLLPELCTQDCPDGRYGLNCTQYCSPYCTGVCHKAIGYCTCKPGFQPHICAKACSDGTWGQDCKQICNHNCADVCNKASGLCTCKPGWRADQNCTKACPEGNYGMNCALSCGACSGGIPCNHINGNCQACRDDFQLPLCQATPFQTKENIVIIASAAAGGFVFIVLSVAVVSCIVRRKRRLSDEATVVDAGSQDHDQDQDRIIEDPSSIDAVLGCQDPTVMNVDPDIHVYGNAGETSKGYESVRLYENTDTAFYTALGAKWKQ